MGDAECQKNVSKGKMLGQGIKGKEKDFEGPLPSSARISL